MTLARDSTSGVAFGVALGVALVSALVSLSPAARLRLLRWAKGLQDAHTPSVLDSLFKLVPASFERPEPRVDGSAICYEAASTTSLEYRSKDVWSLVSLVQSSDLPVVHKWQPTALDRPRATILVHTRDDEEGISFSIVRWVGCLQGMQHPCIAALRFVTVDTTSLRKVVYVGFEPVDTSLQEIVYGTLKRTSHTVVGKPLPDLMLRSFLYQMLHSLAVTRAASRTATSHHTVSWRRSCRARTSTCSSWPTSAFRHRRPRFATSIYPYVRAALRPSWTPTASSSAMARPTTCGRSAPSSPRQRADIATPRRT